MAESHLEGARKSSLPFVNLGCGARFDERWMNIDFSSTRGSVRNFDLRAGIPLPDSSAAVVYHSHLLEHFNRDDAFRLLRECHRVCAPDAILRVVVPDLEKICRDYLQWLDRACAGEDGAEARYDWILLEMFDQITREKEGGAMGDFARLHPSLVDFITTRIGRETAAVGSQKKRSRTLFTRSPWRLLSKLARRVRRSLAANLLDDEAGRALTVGHFRLSGEVHRWMYDRFSLERLLRNSGFDRARICGPGESEIPGWDDFSLEVEPDGSSSKPDSLAMEARKKSD
jgi:SAM-dependent methyltransferase